MYCINLESTDPFFNLAADEFLLKKRQDDFMVLSINRPSVIIGKHQIAHRETDTRFVTEKSIPVVRRISGGGTVFHDMGNLNFSFILNSESGKQVDFRKYSQPVLDFLSSLGIKARFEGKSDLKVDGLKISGNAEHVYHNRVLHHGTLLYDTDLEMLEGSIRKEKAGYLSRAVSSNPSAVTNLKYVLNYVSNYVVNYVVTDVDNIISFRSAMTGWFLENYPGSVQGRLTDMEFLEIGELAKSKYRSWEWNYAYGPEYSFENRFVFKNEVSVCRIFVREGIIRDVEISGPAILSAALAKLKGCRHMPEDIKEILEKENISDEVDIYQLF